MKSKSNNIVVKRKISASVAFFSWLILITIPMFLMCISLEHILFITKEINSSQCKSLLIDEMAQFKQDFTLDSFINKTCKKIIAKNEEFVGSENMQEFASKFKNQGITPSILIRHGKDTQNIQFYYSKELIQNKFKLPTFFTKKLVASLNKQYSHSFYNNNLVKKFRRTYSERNISKQQDKSMSFIKQQLKLGNKPWIEKFKTSAAISGTLNGQIYLTYFPIIERINKQSFVKSGFFLITKATDIDMRKVNKNALHSLNPNIIRSFSSLSKPINTFATKGIFRISSFSKDLNGITIYSTYPIKTLTNIIQEGGIYPKRLKQILGNFPLLKLTMPFKELAHPIQRYTWIIIALSKLVVLLGAILFLRSFLFGLEFNASIRVKLIATISIVFIVPILLSVFAFSIHSKMNIERIKQDKISKLKQYSQILQIEFQNFISLKQIEVIKFANYFMNFETLPNKNFEHYTKQWMIENNAIDSTVAFVNTRYTNLRKKRALTFKDIDLKVINNPNLISKNPIDSDSNILRKIYGKGILQIALTGEVPLNSSFTGRSALNTILVSNGRFLVNDIINAKNIFSSVPIRNKNKRIKGHISFRFNGAVLISEFIKNIAMKTANSYLNSNKIKTAIFQFNNKGLPKLKFSNMNKPSEISMKYIHQSAKLNTSMDWNYQQKGSMYLCSSKYMLPFPFLLLAISQTPIISTNLQFILPLTIYLCAFVIFIYLIFGEMYLEPIQDFVKTAKAIEHGDYTRSIKETSVIEFNKLNQAFANMTYGLEQKEALSHFVSQDVLKAVESNEEIKAGGEKIDATILFVSIDCFDKFVAANSAENIIKLTNKFISLTELEVIKYTGVIDKVIEGSLMLVFKNKGHARNASEAALQIHKSALEKSIIIKSGLATGKVVSGKIGSRIGRLDFTVIGDTVNLAARLKAEAGQKTSLTGIIIAPSSIRALRGKAKVKFITRTNIKGKSRTYPLYELLEIRK